MEKKFEDNIKSGLMRTDSDMEDLYNVFRVTFFVICAFDVWLTLPHSLRRAKVSLNKLMLFMLLCIEFYLTQRNLFKVIGYVDPYLISVRISV
jgi:hypothetical protein